jgi:hypothetical protein
MELVSGVELRRRVMPQALTVQSTANSTNRAGKRRKTGSPREGAPATTARSTTYKSIVAKKYNDEGLNLS